MSAEPKKENTMHLEKNKDIQNGKYILIKTTYYFSFLFFVFPFLVWIFIDTHTYRSGDVQSESKQFQELLLERTKALAAQAEAALKSNSDGKYLVRVSRHTRNPHRHFFPSSISYSFLLLLFFFLIENDTNIYFERINPRRKKRTTTIKSIQNKMKRICLMLLFVYSFPVLNLLFIILYLDFICVH